MTNSRNIGGKNLPKVAISQRSIPKDQLYENKKKIKVRCFVIAVHVINTAKILRISLFSPCITTSCPKSKFLTYFVLCKFMGIITRSYPLNRRKNKLYLYV